MSPEIILRLDLLCYFLASRQESKNNIVDSQRAFSVKQYMIQCITPSPVWGRDAKGASQDKQSNNNAVPKRPGNALNADQNGLQKYCTANRLIQKNFRLT